MLLPPLHLGLESLELGIKINPISFIASGISLQYRKLTDSLLMESHDHLYATCPAFISFVLNVVFERGGVQAQGQDGQFEVATL